VWQVSVVLMSTKGSRLPVSPLETLASQAEESRSSVDLVFLRPWAFAQICIRIANFLVNRFNRFDRLVGRCNLL
jgi:hypothetical protein